MAAYLFFALHFRWKKDITVLKYLERFSYSGISLHLKKSLALTYVFHIQ